MLRNLIIIYWLMIVIACNCSSISQNQSHYLSNNNYCAVKEKHLGFKEADTTESIKDYLNICSDMIIGFGAIQNDKIIKYTYPIGSCNSNEQFEIIWVPIGTRYTNSDYEIMKSILIKEKNIEYKSFNIAVFEIPKIPIDELEEEFSMGLIFPSTVKIYVRVNGNWSYYGSQEIKDFEGFTKIEAEVVAEIDDIE